MNLKNTKMGTFKIKHIDNKHYLFGNKGACWSNRVHIAKSGQSGTLCGTPMLSTNWAAHWAVSQPGCDECIKIYEESKIKQNGKL
jgi:hypothetical protein